MTLKAFRDHDRERFESSLTIIKRKFFEIEPPQELVEELKKHSISVQTVWKDALQKWIEQIRSLVWRKGSVSISVLDDLAGIPVFFTGKHIAFGRAYYSPDETKIILLTDSGEIGDREKKKLEEIVEKLHKKFVFHYLIHWGCDENGVFITRVRTFDELDLVQNAKEKDVITPKEQSITKKQPVKAIS